MRRGDLSQQRLPDVRLVDAQFPGFNFGEQDVLLARALFVECGGDRRDGRRLVEHDRRLCAQIVEDRGALVERQREPRLRDVVLGRKEGRQLAARRRRPFESLENSRSIRLFARNLAPGDDLEQFDRRLRALRLDTKGTHRLDRIAEKLDAHREVGAGCEEVEDAAANGVLADRADDVAADVSEPI